MADTIAKPQQQRRQQRAQQQTNDEIDDERRDVHGERCVMRVRGVPAPNANELTHHSLFMSRHRRQALSLHGSTIISLPLGPGWNEFGPAVVRVRTAKSAVAGDHLLHAHFVGWQTAIVMKGMARISARAPRHLSGLADAKVEQHCHATVNDLSGRYVHRVF
jgi:hypothetical protein